jgi:hypothetical protein
LLDDGLLGAQLTELGIDALQLTVDDLHRLEQGHELGRRTRQHPLGKALGDTRHQPHAMQVQDNPVLETGPGFPDAQWALRVYIANNPLLASVTGLVR